MSKVATKAKGNIFYEARILSEIPNRVVASAELCINRRRVEEIELDRIEPYPEEILKMAELYKADHLINHYCNNICAIGKKFGCSFKVENNSDIYKTSVMLIGSLKQANKAKDVLLQILEDGEITDDELELADETLKTLTNLMKDVVNLKIALEKIKR